MKRRVTWDIRLRAWREYSACYDLFTYWTWQPFIGWMQHAEDEIEWLRGLPENSKITYKTALYIPGIGIVP